MGKDKKTIHLLEKQVEKLDKDPFDLDAWKNSTTSILERIYGDSSKVKAIQAIKIDYSSWALRDSTGNYNPLDSAKNMGREILAAAIDEIEALGLPEAESSPTDISGVVLEICGQKLAPSMVKKLKKLLSSEKEASLESLEKALKGSPEEDLRKTLAALLLLKG